MIYEDLHLKNYYTFLGNDGRDPVLSVYLPENIHEMKRDDMLHPSILVCPGGAYAFVSEREAEPIALNFIPDGYNVFVLWYSVAPHCFPVQLTEAAAAMDLIRRKAVEWHCDTDKTAIMGFSAGGHLAAHYCTSYDCPEVRKFIDEPVPAAAAILGYPVITAEKKYTHLNTILNVSGKKEITEDTAEKFSCDRLATASTPPAFIWHTAEDGGVNVMNSLKYAAALSECGVPFELHVFPHGGHGLSTADDVTMDDMPDNVRQVHEWIPLAKRWLKDLFR